MLIPKGQIIHENLNTSYTHIDQLVERLQGQVFSGYCHVSFWEYDGIILFENGNMFDAREERGTRAAEVSIGEEAIQSVLKKAREKDGEISVYLLPRERVILLADFLEGTPKYEQLSTDLTSLDKVMGLLEKEQITGYIEVLLNDDAGVANLFFSEGALLETLMAPPDNQILADPTTLPELHSLCHEHGGLFNVYQATDLFTPETLHEAHRSVPQDVLNLFEAILVALEMIANATLKQQDFQDVLNMHIQQVADTYTFLDPFVGDFRFKNSYLSYNGDVPFDEFVSGLCELVNLILATLLKHGPREALLPKISTTLEPVAIKYEHLIDQLNLEVRMPKVFQDYAFRSEEFADDSLNRAEEGHKVLNLRGVGVAEISQQDIIRELQQAISAIVKGYVNPAENQIQYAALRDSQEYRRYQKAAGLLQKFNVAVLKKPNLRLAFWLNIYNFLVLDGILEFGVSASVQHVKGFFTKAAYRLGEYLFSLNDIEHGILRNNQRRPYSLSQQFRQSDPRLAFCVDPPDVRLHCCVCTGAVSSPALGVYASRELDAQLDAAVRQFLLTHGLRVDQEKNELWLSRMFYWYRKDFSRSGTSVLDFVISSLEQEDIGQFIQENRDHLTLRFMDYDWGLNTA